MYKIQRSNKFAKVILVLATLGFAGCNDVSVPTPTQQGPGMQVSLIQASATNVDISPAGQQTITNGSSESFTVTAHSGFTISSSIGGNCPAGSWNGSIYTTKSISNDCSISFSGLPFPAVTTLVNNVAILPSGVQSVAPGSTQSFTLTANQGYAIPVSVGGTCQVGSWSGNVYTSGPITNDCSISFDGLKLYSMSSSATNVTISPSTVQLVASGFTQSFMVNANKGYQFSNSVGGTCPAGSWNGSIYTTGPVKSDCSVSFTNFDAIWGVTPYSDLKETSSFSSSAEDPSGNVYAAGAVFLKPQAFGAFLPIIYKYSASGAQQSKTQVNWIPAAGVSAGTARNNPYARFSSIAADSKGNIFAAGFYTDYGTYDFGNGVTASGTNSSNLFFFLVKYNSSGLAQWIKSVSNSSVSSLAVDSKGNVCAAGNIFPNYGQVSFSASFGNSVTIQGQAQGILLAKFDTDGNALWAKTSNNTNNGFAQFNSIALDSNDNLYAAGVTGFGNNDFGNNISVQGLNSMGVNNVVLSNMLVVKYDKNGSAQWAQTNNTGTNGITLQSVAVDSSGYVIVSGFQGAGTYDYGNSKSTNLVEGGSILLKYNSSGIPQWVQSIDSSPGGGRELTFVSVAVDKSGNIFTVGTQQSSSLDFGNGVISQLPSSVQTGSILTKFNSSGVPQYVFNPSSPTASSQLVSVNIDASGNIFALGSVFSGGTYGFNSSVSIVAAPLNSPEVDAFLVKFK